MHPCPISLERLFMLIGAFEGLSLWGTIDQFPRSARHAAYIRWTLVKGELPISKITCDAFAMLKKLIIFNFFYPAFAFTTRVLKWLPALVTVVSLVFYSSYPVFTNQSASVLFYNNWKLFCSIIALVALFRLLLFYFAHLYFMMFELTYKEAVSVKVLDPSPNDFSVDL